MVASKIAMEGCCMRDELKDAFKVSETILACNYEIFQFLGYYHRLII